MKRIVFCFLALCLVLSGCASAPLEFTVTGDATATATAGTQTTASGDHDPTGFAVGFGRADITPETPVPLAGYGATSLRRSQNVLDPLYATCAAVSDGEDVMLIFQMDVINIVSSVGDTLRKLVTEATGVPDERILVNCTHTHSGPTIGTSTDAAVYLAYLYPQVVEAAKAAIADLDRCTTMRVGKTETDRLNFVRRYYGEGGGFITDSFDTSPTGKAEKHETEVDEEMRILFFDRVNQPDIVVSNWQCHPHATGGMTKTDISSDIVGSFRSNVEKKLGVKFLYLQGGAGNITPTSRIEGEGRYTEYREIGKALYETLAAGMDQLSDLPTGAIRTNKRELTVDQVHSQEELLDVAEKIQAAFSAGKTKEAKEMAKEAGLASPYEAGAIIDRAKRAATGTFALYCYAIGDLALAAAPFEMFDTTGQFVRANSPFSFTLYCGYSNDMQGYMPTRLAHQNGGYEVYTTYYVPGTAELIGDTQVEMLGELHS